MAVPPVKQAAQLGKKAFQTGLKRIPAQDSQIWELIRKAKTSKEYYNILESWFSAWDRAKQDSEN